RRDRSRTCLADSVALGDGAEPRSLRNESILNSDPPEEPGVGDRNGDDTMAESAVVPRASCWPGRAASRSSGAYHEMAVVDWEIG
ncbi:MAG: hypothetical protein WAL63_11040, partial [Solirubrobacteraceae bacterium]